MGSKVCKEKKKKQKDGKLKYECKKCGERALKEKHVCKPRKLK
jgi:hypothetical protein